MSDRFTNMLFMGLVSNSLSVTPVTPSLDCSPQRRQLRERASETVFSASVLVSLNPVQAAHLCHHLCTVLRRRQCPSGPSPGRSFFRYHPSLQAGANTRPSHNVLHPEQALQLRNLNNYTTAFLSLSDSSAHPFPAKSLEILSPPPHKSP